MEPGSQCGEPIARAMLVIVLLLSSNSGNKSKFIYWCITCYVGEENSKLLSELDKESKEVARLLLVESEVQELKVVLDEVQAKLKNTTLELDKTQARNKNVERHKKVKCSSRKHKYVEY